MLLPRSFFNTNYLQKVANIIFCNEKKLYFTGAKTVLHVDDSPEFNQAFQMCWLMLTFHLVE